jgi:F0F1-type ATP synthase assembly protein I
LRPPLIIWYTIPKMVSSPAPKKKTSPDTGDKKEFPDPAALRSTFIAAAVTMSWQLAIAVVVPIVAGYEIDQGYGTSPWWEITGFVVAALGFYGVVRYQLQQLNDDSKKKGLTHDRQYAEPFCRLRSNCLY